ncbi:hypothetical protein ROZALSC1DRAFT_29651 [Rozella allomycis CSF55]|uniref:Uncharacterized protein n=1 Tax=Rozella allomycis (strain CSF55) TaxID=988480 RepID=A0A075ANF1_ROZAC|nr:hypothetical protein O9G_005878 [Rozella allomycis CSF55]RKP18677.1 hypothetical protein ROZALSC1DRAFT_29651 [Rozella allomycis CSF55]|eukprot:EPZ31362.1 hypothetical protein O9G_005878 [Rozella allomycis CSF55]
MDWSQSHSQSPFHFPAHADPLTNMVLGIDPIEHSLFETLNSVYMYPDHMSQLHPTNSSMDETIILDTSQKKQDRRSFSKLDQQPPSKSGKVSMRHVSQRTISVLKHNLLQRLSQDTASTVDAAMDMTHSQNGLIKSLKSNSKKSKSAVTKTGNTTKRRKKHEKDNRVDHLKRDILGGLNDAFDIADGSFGYEMF